MTASTPREVTVSDVISELFRHNLWANLRLLDASRALSAAQLQATVPGTYGSVHHTLWHIVACEERYVALLTNEWPERPLGELRRAPPLDDLVVSARRTGMALLRAAREANPGRVLRGVWQGRPYAFPVAVPLVQAITHGAEHRAQVAVVLSRQGVTPPERDGWAYHAAGGLRA
jgi:uncharacterized damage-inducible protein DinB